MQDRCPFLDEAPQPFGNRAVRPVAPARRDKLAGEALQMSADIDSKRPSRKSGCFDDIREAHRLMESSEANGKIVVRL